MPSLSGVSDVVVEVASALLGIRWRSRVSSSQGIRAAHSTQQTQPAVATGARDARRAPGTSVLIVRSLDAAVG
jgi:hypothetical protein